MVKSSPLKSKFLKLSSSPDKIGQISFVNFEASQFLFRFFIILQCHYTELLCNFLARAFCTLDKRIPWKYQFWHCQVLWWKFSKFFMLFSKPQVSFSSNFAWLFSVMKDNSYVLFQIKHYIFHMKGINQGVNKQLKSPKISLWWAVFVQSIWGLS